MKQTESHVCLSLLANAVSHFQGNQLRGCHYSDNSHYNFVMGAQMLGTSKSMAAPYLLGWTAPVHQVEPRAA